MSPLGVHMQPLKDLEHLGSIAPIVHGKQSIQIKPYLKQARDLTTHDCFEHFEYTEVCAMLKNVGIQVCITWNAALGPQQAKKAFTSVLPNP